MEFGRHSIDRLFRKAATFEQATEMRIFRESPLDDFEANLVANLCNYSLLIDLSNISLFAEFVSICE
jgi:hypothetical protein